MIDTKQLNKIDKDTAITLLRYILRNNFYAFCLFYDPGFFTSAKQHLKIIANALQKVTDGTLKKLMISVPPRAGKSYTVSLWCAWMIGKNFSDPNLSIMRNSYGQTLAEKFSYDIRDILLTDKFLFVFPAVRLKSDHSSVKDWAVSTAAQSTYFCSGVGGAITGKGCKTAAILDDPIKNLEDAMSEVILEKTWLWYLSTHKSRLESQCPEIHIATRWSLRDPIGMLIQEQGDDWEQIIIPALDEKGKSFCEEIKTTDEYYEIKKILDEFVWEAEFMQNPVEAKGLLFPPNELKRFKGNNFKNIDTIFGFTDTADEGDNFLASITAILCGDKVFIHDVIFTQDPIEITMPQVAGQLIKNKHNSQVIESNNGGKPFSLKVRELIRGKSRCVVRWKHESKNKETRMLMNSGQVKEYFYFRTDYKPGSDYDKFMRQLTSYVKMGKNKNDDAPDAVTGVAEQLFGFGGLRILSNKKI